MLRRILFAVIFLAGLIAPAFAQPAPVPVLPDTERRTSYSISGSTCACAVNFALYGDGTDYGNWVQVWLNGVLQNSSTYTITSPTGPLASIARPITDAVLTFNSPTTGTVQIVGARRPRQLSQFQENQGVTARNLNQRLTDITAIERELWDKTNDVTGRAILTQPGNTMKPLPPPASCINFILGFGADGLTPTCLSAVGPAGPTGPTGPTGPQGPAGGLPGWITTANAAGVIQTTFGTISAGTNSLTVGSIAGWTNGAGIWVMNAGAAAADLVTTINGAPSGNIITLTANAGTTVTNAVVGPTGAITNGQTTLTISNPNGWAINQGISVKGAGVSGADLITIVSNIAGNVFTLGASASTTVTNAIVNHDDTAALTSAINSAIAASYPNQPGIPVAYIGAGNYNITSALPTIKVPVYIRGDGRGVTTIWNRSATATAFTFQGQAPAPPNGYNALNNAISITNMSIRQALDVLSTSSVGISLGQKGSAFYLSNALIKNIAFNDLFQDLVVNDPINGLVVDSVSVACCGPLGAVAGNSNAIHYDAVSPSGDNWFSNINIYIGGTTTIAGIRITNGDANTWSNIKVNGGIGLLFDATAAANVQNQRFINFVIENSGQFGSGTGCAIDFGSNGIGSGTFLGAQFLGGGLLALHGSICNPSSYTVVGFVNDNFSTTGGNIFANQINLCPTGTSNCGASTGNAWNSLIRDDAGPNISVLSAIQDVSTSQYHFNIAGRNGNSLYTFATDASGMTYATAYSTMAFSQGATTAGLIQIISPADGTIKDALTTTTDGAVGIGNAAVASIFETAQGANGNSVVTMGETGCIFDNTAVHGDWATFSATNAGQCHDIAARGSAHGVGRVIGAGTGNQLVLVQPF